MKDKGLTRLPFAYGTSTTAGLGPCNSIPSPSCLRGLKRFRAQLREDGDVSWALGGLRLRWNKRLRSVLPCGDEEWGQLRAED
jgi:hypothetical protein